MLIAEHIDDEGSLRQTTFELCDGGARLSTDGDSVVVPVRAVLLAMRRFGRDLSPDIEPNGETINLGGGFTLQRLDFRAAVDAEPKTYLVLHGDGPPQCALSTEVAGALRFLGDRK